MADTELVKKHPPRVKTPAYKKYWSQFLDDIAVRDNFKENHLSYLHILCELLVEYDEVQEILKAEGLTYETYSKNGAMQLKTKPEVVLRDKAMIEIRNFSKLLKVGLFEDKKLSGKKDSDDDWE